MTTPAEPVDEVRLLISGATGMIGGLLVTELERRAVPFAVMVRPSSDHGRFSDRGIEVVEGDFDDRASLTNALTGVSRAFLLTNSTDRAETQQLAFVAAAREAGVRRLVKLSQLHAAADSPVRFLRYHAAVEAAIEDSGIGHVSVRPNLILQAYLPYAGAIANGVLQAPIGDARVSVGDAHDIAAVAAAALTEDGHEGRRYDLTGPEALTHAEIAAAFGDAIGREVAFQPVAPEAFVAAIEQAGVPAWQAEGLAEDYAHYERGEAAAVSEDTYRVTGRPARTIADFAADHADALAARD